MDVDNCIALVGIAVTGAFSLLIWRATNATNKLNEETLKLNKEINNRDVKREREYNNIMRNLLVDQLIKETQLVEHALSETNVINLHKNLLSEGIPKVLFLNEKQLATYFSQEEVSLIKKTWAKYEEYIEKYLRNGYKGNGMNILLEKSPPVLEALNEIQNYYKNKRS